MDQGAQGIIIHSVISLVAAATTHGLIRSFWSACYVSAITSAIVFNLVATIQQGYLDKFFLVALIFSGFYAFAISAVVGLAFKMLRRKNERKDL
jgi:hypothetical protein